MRQIVAAILLSLLLVSCGSNSREIRSDPERSFAHFYNLGLAAFEQKDYQEAIRHFLQSIELNPNVARTHKELGTTYLFLENNDAAAASFERALNLDSRLVEVHNSLGIAYLNLGKYREAEQQFNALLNEPEYNTLFIPYFNLGNLYFQQQNFSQALLYYLEALKEETEITTDYRMAVHRQLGYVYFHMEDYEKALAEFEQVLVLNPRDIESAYQGGMSARKLGKDEDAIQMFTKVMTINPNSQLAQEARKQLDEMIK